MIATSLLLSALLAKGLVTDHPVCEMSPLNRNYSVCFVGSASSDGVQVIGTDAASGTVLFVNKKGEMFPAEPGRYEVDPSIANPKNYPPFIVSKYGNYRQYIGASELENGTKIEFYFYDLLGHDCDVYTISEDGKIATELKDGKYALKNGQYFTVENAVVKEGVYDPETGKIIDPLAGEK